MTYAKRRLKCPTCGRRVTIDADRFIEHLVASYSAQYCPYGGCTIEEAQKQIDESSERRNDGE